MLWLLSAVNRESGCVTAHSGRANARARVREQLPWGVGGSEMMQAHSRVAHCEYIASSAQAVAYRRHAGSSGRRSRLVARAWARPGPGPARAARGAMRKTPKARRPPPRV